MKNDTREVFAKFNQTQTKNKSSIGKVVNQTTSKRVNKHKSNSGNRSSGRGR